jgi:signal transduction histidine kinase
MATYPERVLHHTYAWMRGHPRAADGMLAVVLFASSAGQLRLSPATTALAAIVVNLLLATTVAIRRQDPVLAFSLVAGIGVAQAIFGFRPNSDPPVRALQPTVTDLAIVILLYTLAASRPRRISLAGLAICLAGSAIAIARWTYSSRSTAVLLLAVAALGATMLTAWVLGDSTAYRRAYYVSLEDRLAAAERARDLELKRARAVDDSAARLRRIERDLHDGAQVRLAALAMALGEIKENLARAGREESTLKLASAAHQNAKDTLAELRDLARGIHPPVLDRGLGPALSILAGTSAVPVELTAGIADRPSPAIEAIAYFCVAELLANAAKHSSARNVTIDVRDRDAGLLLTVTDDGAGGAHVAPGGGLAGLLERVQTVDGRLDVHSPAGGPTTVTVELPRHA